MMFDKKQYWKNRKDGKRGQGETLKPKMVETDIPQNGKISFGDDGNMIMNNRAYRRRRISLFPKSSQLRKKGKTKSYEQISRERIAGN